MLKKTIKYTDYDGVERNEDFYFNLSKAEIMEMQLEQAGGLANYMAKLIKSQDIPEIVKIFKVIIEKAYGEKSDDGKRFVKVNEHGVPLVKYFKETEAFSVLYTELASDAKKASEFINAVIPADLQVSDEKQAEALKELGLEVPSSK